MKLEESLSELLTRCTLNLHSAVLRSAPLVRATLPRVGIGRVSGLEAIIVTDRDGVIISKGARVARQSCSIQRAPYDLRPSVQSWRQIRNCRKRPSAVAHLRRTFSSRQSRHRISQSEPFLGVAVTLQIRQATKLKLGKNKSITAFYDKRTVHHINNAPLVPPTSPSHMRPHRTCAYVVTTRPSPHAPRSRRANPPRAFTSSRIGSCAQVISFIGDAELNVGHISLIISQLTRLLEPVRQKINTDI